MAGKQIGLVQKKTSSGGEPVFIEMPFKAVVYCGYVDILVHLNCGDRAAIRNYNKTVGAAYPNLLVKDEKAWQTQRKILSAALRNK